MPTLPIFQVDAFADRPFTGNPAAVCPLPAPLPDALMQDIAAENNLSETAFFYPEPSAPVGDVYNLRWFTPTIEVDLCGHATLASAFVLMTQLDDTRNRVAFRTRSGVLTVRRWQDDHDAHADLYELDLPVFPAAPASVATAMAAVAVALGGAPVEILRARAWLAVYPSAAAIRDLTPDMPALARLDTTVCVTAPGDGDADFVCRYFAPSHGVPEDPVTGSAFCTLAPYWAARLGKDRLSARQLSRRGGQVFCELRDQRVLVAGRARLVIGGTFHY